MNYIKFDIEFLSKIKEKLGGLNSTQALIISYIKNWGKKGCGMPQSTIARELFLSLRSLKNYLPSLINQGVIEKKCVGFKRHKYFFNENYLKNKNVDIYNSNEDEDEDEEFF